jgi:hypothetical protein
MEIVKITDGNGDVVYKVRPTKEKNGGVLDKIFGSNNGGYYWSNGELGGCGGNFTKKGAKRFIKSLNIQLETVSLTKKKKKRKKCKKLRHKKK